jgi:hypothetical protein
MTDGQATAALAKAGEPVTTGPAAGETAVIRQASVVAGRRKTADAIVEENANARINGLRTALSLLAIVALIALFACRRIPAQQPAAGPASEAPT